MAGASRHPDIVDRAASAVFVVDVQERFRSHISDFDGMVAGARLLIEAATRLGVPVASSEQYPKGLGHTVEELAAVIPAGSPSFEKLEISSVAAPGWEQLPPDFRARRQLVLVGIEAHVCVRQTALDAMYAGYDVHVPIDAVASRSVLERDTALAGLARAGARVSTVESVLFDWLGAAGSAEFKDVQALLKARAAGA